MVISSVIPGFRPRLSIIAINFSMANNNSFVSSINVSARQVCLLRSNSLQYRANPFCNVVIGRRDSSDVSDDLLMRVIVLILFIEPTIIIAFFFALF